MLRAPSILRPLGQNTFRSSFRVVATRGFAAKPDPKTKATALIDALPGSTPLSKTGIIATGTAAGIYGVANELLLFNAEALMLMTFLGIATAGAKFLGPLYSKWADGYIGNIKNILFSARDKHTKAVQDRIDSVSQLKNVVDTTKDLFALSKNTAHLEADAFELNQKVQLASTAKSVLDSWVRYEASVREREQKHLAESIIATIQKDVSSAKFQKEVLAESVAEIEKIFSQYKA